MFLEKELISFARIRTPDCSVHSLVIISTTLFRIPKRDLKNNKMYFETKTFASSLKDKECVSSKLVSVTRTIDWIQR
jgi:hypothetical protein